jgi:hypothetical protein
MKKHYAICLLLSLAVVDLIGCSNADPPPTDVQEGVLRIENWSAYPATVTLDSSSPWSLQPYNTASSPGQYYYEVVVLEGDHSMHVTLIGAAGDKTWTIKVPAVSTADRITFLIPYYTSPDWN